MQQANFRVVAEVPASAPKASQKKRFRSDEDEIAILAKRNKQTTSHPAGNGIDPEPKDKQQHQEAPAVSTVVATEPVIPPKHPFCCDMVKPSDPDALYTCNNKTCQQRHQVKIFVRYLKRFAYTEVIAQADNPQYAIGITELEHLYPKKLSSSRAKQANESYRLVGTTRFFIESSEEETDRFAEALGHADRFEEEWDRVDDSEMGFGCSFHPDATYMCSLWLPPVKKSKR